MHEIVLTLHDEVRWLETSIEGKDDCCILTTSKHDHMRKRGSVAYYQTQYIRLYDPLNAKKNIFCMCEWHPRQRTGPEQSIARS